MAPQPAGTAGSWDSGDTRALKLQIAAAEGRVRLVIEGLDPETEEALWDAHDEAGGLARCSAINRTTGYRRGMTSRSASTTPLDIEFVMDAHSIDAADAIHLRIPACGIDLTFPTTVRLG